MESMTGYTFTHCVASNPDRRHASERANHYSLVASPMCPIGNPEMLSTSNFYDGNVIYVVWKDKLA